MWPFSSQLGLATFVALFVTTWLFAAVEGYPINDLLECQHYISATYEDKCTKYNEHKDSRCHTIFETAKCLMKKACKYCSAEVVKEYSEWMGEMTSITFNGTCDSYLPITYNLMRYCSDIKPVTLSSSMSSITGVTDVTEVTEVTSQSKQSKSALLIILAVVLVLLLLASLAIWCICYRRHRRKTFNLATGRRSAKKSMKSTTMSSPNSPAG